MSKSIVIKTSSSTTVEGSETVVTAITSSTPAALIEKTSQSSITVSPVGQVGPPGPPGNSGYSEGVAGATISVYQVLAISGDQVVPADPTNLAHAGRVIGVAIQSAIAGSTVQYVKIGTILGGSWTPEALYYLGLGGNLSTTPRATGAVFQQMIGIGKTSTSFCISLSPPLLLE